MKNKKTNKIVFDFRIWNLKSGKCIKTIENASYCYCIKKISDREIVTGSDFGLIKIWDLDSGAYKKMLIGHRNWVIKLDILPSGELISASLDKTIMIWDLRTGICINTYV
jgi:WD40 repeat protein